MTRMVYEKTEKSPMSFSFWRLPPVDCPAEPQEYPEKIISVSCKQKKTKENNKIIIASSAHAEMIKKLLDVRDGINECLHQNWN